MLHTANCVYIQKAPFVNSSAWAWSIPKVKSAGTEKETRLYLAPQNTSGNSV